MIQVVIVGIADYSTEAQTVQSLTSTLPLPVQSKLSKISNPVNRTRSAIGELLSSWALSRFKGIKPGEAVISYGKNGKPFLESHPDIHFNISHSGEYVVCAVADHEVGIDVERVRAYNHRVAERFFSKAELADLEALEGENRLNYFFVLWTIKESYLKALGRGLTKSLSSFTVAGNGNGYYISENSETLNYAVKSLMLPGGYYLAVCIKGFSAEVLVNSITLSEISEHLSAGI